MATALTLAGGPLRETLSGSGLTDHCAHLTPAGPVRDKTPAIFAMPNSRARPWNPASTSRRPKVLVRAARNGPPTPWATCVFHTTKGMPSLDGVKVAILESRMTPGMPSHVVAWMLPTPCEPSSTNCTFRRTVLASPTWATFIRGTLRRHPACTRRDHRRTGPVEHRPHHDGWGPGAHVHPILGLRKAGTHGQSGLHRWPFRPGRARQGLAESSYLSHIVLRQPNFLFNYSNLGFRKPTWWIKPGIELMDKLFFDAHRLGELRANITEAEPVLRNADTVSIDMTSIRRADARHYTARPQWLPWGEMCPMRYAGISEKVTWIGLYELDPWRDQDQATAQLAAQMVWCFLDGFGSALMTCPGWTGNGSPAFMCRSKGMNRNWCSIRAR